MVSDFCCIVPSMYFKCERVLNKARYTPTPRSSQLSLNIVKADEVIESWTISGIVSISAPDDM